MTLLRDYSAQGSEAAFAELVSRRVGFVYSAALRQVGDAHQAQEVTHVVFIILSQKATRISDKTNLAGWLFKTTRFVALAQNRAAAARRQREQDFHMQTDISNVPHDPVWELISPHLDEALMRLGETDRQTVLLHCFARKSFAEISSIEPLEVAVHESSAELPRRRVLAQSSIKLNLDLRLPIIV